jgi:uncharacterized protein (DUF885 family)
MAFQTSLNRGRSASALKYTDEPRHRSLLSPVQRLFPERSTDYDTARYKAFERQLKLVEEFQRDSLSGFTTKELIDLDAVSDRHLRGDRLSNPMMPILRQDSWESNSNSFVSLLLRKRCLSDIGKEIQCSWFMMSLEWRY